MREHKVSDRISTKSNLSTKHQSSMSIRRTDRPPYRCWSDHTTNIPTALHEILIAQRISELQQDYPPARQAIHASSEDASHTRTFHRFNSQLAPVESARISSLQRENSPWRDYLQRELPNQHDSICIPTDKPATSAALTEATNAFNSRKHVDSSAQLTAADICVTTSKMFQSGEISFQLCILFWNIASVAFSFGWGWWLWLNGDAPPPRGLGKSLPQNFEWFHIACLFERKGYLARQRGI
jgi:hypothetical protein